MKSGDIDKEDSRLGSEWIPLVSWRGGGRGNNSGAHCRMRSSHRPNDTTPNCLEQVILQGTVTGNAQGDPC